MGTETSVAAEKNVDFPTLGLPTTPMRFPNQTSPGADTTISDIRSGSWR